ncbi:site-specific integrase [Streptomyces noursei]|uniref:site-specific integrase n=1 Tax=Streptomyces noursei TaxID=1971 RepID=UPI0036D24BB9
MYPAFVLAVALGLRRGEILGLHWRDVDLGRRTLTVRSTLDRGGKELYLDTTKNRRARVIPVPLMCVAPLRWQRLRQAGQRSALGTEWHDSGLVFTTRSGRPIEPRNLYRSFQRISASASLPPVRLHDTRHGCASLLFASGSAVNAPTIHDRGGVSADPTRAMQATEGITALVAYRRCGSCLP